ncbi:Na-translocating system protein MpsC family protein [Evansella tamaricis]|nr:Na-translocating system protein MpsC family protein [Evansella tamaricis]
MNNQDILSKISSYTSKMLRQKFGRGPESCRATLGINHLVLYIRGFVSPMEEVLLKTSQTAYVNHARDVIIKHVMEELKGVVQISLDVEVEEYFHDWNFTNNTGMLMLVLNGTTETEQVHPNFNKQALELEVARITSLVQREPDAIKTYILSENVILVERIGILIPIEKALILKGYSSELLLTKDDLEKSYFHRDANFNTIFTTPVQDLFIDWDFKEDKSMVGFVLK